jgi:hypothetical protein
MENIKIYSLAEISKFLQDKKLHTVSKLTGLSFPTLKRLNDEVDYNYTLKTLRTISNYISNSQKI